MFSFKLEPFITWVSFFRLQLHPIYLHFFSEQVFFYLFHSSPLPLRIHVFQTFPSPFYQELESKVYQTHKGITTWQQINIFTLYLEMEANL